jgi:hypothetical protein
VSELKNNTFKPPLEGESLLSLLLLLFELVVVFSESGMVLALLVSSADDTNGEFVDEHVDELEDEADAITMGTTLLPPPVRGVIALFELLVVFVL